jgi:hypothetical protein
MAGTEIRWWVVDLQHDARPGGHLFPAPSARAAIAEIRRMMIVHYQGRGDSARFAADVVRAMVPRVLAGPLDPYGAYQHLVTWEWAWAVAGRLEAAGQVPTEPAQPVFSRLLAVELLGPDRTAVIEEACAAEIGIDL